MSGGSPAEISASGTRWLDANPDGAAEAVVVYDAYITMAGTKKDALLLECRSVRAADNPREDRRAVPPASSPRRVRRLSAEVHRRRD